MSNVLDRIEAAGRKAKSKGMQSFGELVRAIATGGKIDSAAAAEVLESTGKTRADVEKILRELANARGNLKAIADTTAARAALTAKWGIEHDDWGKLIRQRESELAALRGAARQHSAMGMSVPHCRHAVEKFKQEHPVLVDLVEVKGGDA